MTHLDFDLSTLAERIVESPDVDLVREMVTFLYQALIDVEATDAIGAERHERALSHHERLDGSGYPRQLKGEEISLGARIVAVADVVEAMAHLRPYRAPLGLTTALDTITQGAGKLFDREVVNACHAVFSVGFSYDTPPRSAS